MKSIIYLGIGLCFAVNAAYAQPANGNVTAGNQQQVPRPQRPVFGEIAVNPDVHDPVMAKQGDTYYVFYTGSGSWSSKDMVNWKREKPVFDNTNKPNWLSAAGFSRPGYWAPDIHFFNGQWYLYYSNSAFGKNTSAIGVATNKTLDPLSPDYKWVDHGKVIQSYPGKTNWNAIDPNLAIDKKTGDPYLVFGSFWHGMQLVKLAKDGFGLANPADTIATHTVASKIAHAMVANDTPPVIAGKNAIEAPFIFSKGKYYYLFVSWDYCCKGPASDYRIAVGRSEKITGPYLDKKGVDMANGGGTIVKEGDGKEFFGLGHNAAYTFDGKDYLIYHGYLVIDAEKNRTQNKLVIEKLNWDKEGWPVVGERITPVK